MLRPTLEPEAGRTAAFFRSLVDPTRLAIVRRFALDEARVVDVSVLGWTRAIALTCVTALLQSPAISSSIVINLSGTASAAGVVLGDEGLRDGASHGDHGGCAGALAQCPSQSGEVVGDDRARDLTFPADLVDAGGRSSGLWT